MTFPKSPDLSPPDDDHNTPRGPMPTWLREAHEQVNAEEAARREAMDIQLDDEPCSECGGAGEVEIQVDVDEVKVYACPKCCDEDYRDEHEPAWPTSDLSGWKDSSQ